MRSGLLRLPVLLLLLSGCIAERPNHSDDCSPARVAQSDRVAPTPEQRRIAITFDDLPASRDGTYGLERMKEVTTRLLDQLQRADITAVGFVNEGKLGQGSGRAPRIALLRQWLEAGMELGNHTYSHVKFWDTPLARYEQNVLNGERVTRALLAEKEQSPRYFRHPYLNTGPTLEAKNA